MMLFMSVKHETPLLFHNIYNGIMLYKKRNYVVTTKFRFIFICVTKNKLTIQQITFSPKNGSPFAFTEAAKAKFSRTNKEPAQNCQKFLAGCFHPV